MTGINGSTGARAYRRDDRWVVWAAIAAALAPACAPAAPPQTSSKRLEDSASAAFKELMDRVARGWSTQNTDLALSAFAPDALYTEPPDLQIYRGHSELRPFFDAVTKGSSMIWHHLWFNPSTQTGSGEYSFHKGGRTTAVHGVAVIELVNGKIFRWREYQRRGAIDYDVFHDPKTKDWKSTAAGFSTDVAPSAKEAAGRRSGQPSNEVN